MPPAGAVKIAVPNKGRLSEKTLETFAQAGVVMDDAVGERRLFATALNGQFAFLFVRAQDIPEYVHDGVAHAGVTGFDILRESGKATTELLDLGFGHCKLVVAAPESSRVRSLRDVPAGARVATSFPRLTAQFFRKARKRVRVVEVSGATEITPQVGVADLVVDLTATGSTLAINRLRPVATVLESTARLVANREALGDRRLGRQVRELAWALQSVVAARGKRYVMANVPRRKVRQVAKVLPGISGPTIVELGSRDDMVAAHAVVDETALYRVVNDLKALGAEGILVVPVTRLVG
ncbi:MAG TPA: ATP phosphoribosyltransferase [Candidatus Thermoplasmatota archaeon]|nr:ATP phosphoribosyltransferase [Candidatus Thermoplasmatota archaeon]